jgi:hypothetical protein
MTEPVRAWRLTGEEGRRLQQIMRRRPTPLPLIDQQPLLDRRTFLVSALGVIHAEGSASGDDNHGASEGNTG